MTMPEIEQGELIGVTLTVEGRRLEVALIQEEDGTKGIVIVDSKTSVDDYLINVEKGEVESLWEMLKSLDESLSTFAKKLIQP